MGKRENADYQHFFLFPQCFLLVPKRITVINLHSFCSLQILLTLSSIYTHFNTLKKKSLRKHCGKKVTLVKMSNFVFSHNVCYAICILKSLNSHISVVVCSFLEFWTVSKWCIREWVYLDQSKNLLFGKELNNR